MEGWSMALGARWPARRSIAAAVGLITLGFLASCGANQSTTTQPNGASSEVGQTTTTQPTSASYEESYQGRRVFVTTSQTAAGTWTSEAEIADDGQRVPVAGTSGHIYGTEEEARRAAFSAAAASIDRARASQGKP